MGYREGINIKTNKMEDNKIEEVWNLTVTKHSIEKFKLRTDTRASDMQAANRMRNIVLHGVEMEIKDEVKRVRQLLKHDLQEARYFKENGKHGPMVVLVGRAIVTAHNAEHEGKWSPKLNEAKV